MTSQVTLSYPTTQVLSMAFRNHKHKQECQNYQPFLPMQLLSRYAVIRSPAVSQTGKRYLYVVLDEDIIGVANWGYYANCCFWLLYVRSFELVLFFTFIIFLELGNYFMDIFMKTSCFIWWRAAHARLSWAPVTLKAFQAFQAFQGSIIGYRKTPPRRYLEIYFSILRMFGMLTSLLTIYLVY